MFVFPGRTGCLAHESLSAWLLAYYHHYNHSCIITKCMFDSIVSLAKAQSCCESWHFVLWRRKQAQFPFKNTTETNKQTNKKNGVHLQPETVGAALTGFRKRWATRWPPPGPGCWSSSCRRSLYGGRPRTPSSVRSRSRVDSHGHVSH